MYSDREKAALATMAIGMAIQLPIYYFIAYFSSKLLFGSTENVGYIIGVFIIVWFISSIVGVISGSITWRIYNKRKTVALFVQFMRDNKFPPRKYEAQRFSDYLARISSNIETVDYSVELVRAADEIESGLLAAEEFGMLHGMRIHAAWEKAFNLYSPPANK